MIERHELKALTSARGLAAWMVVLFHIRLSMNWAPADAVAIFAKGYLAVDFFFLLSGFVIWLTWAERIRLRGWKAVPHFLQKRVARIWPLHLAILAVMVGLALLLAATGRADPDYYPFGELPLHVFLLQNWGLTHELAWNDPSWSISCELAAYLVFPLLALAIDWRRIPSWAVLAAVVAMITLLHAIMASRGASTLGTGITRFGLMRCLMEFASGGAVCALWLRWRTRPRVPGCIAAALAVALFCSWLGGLTPETLAMPLAFAALLLALALSCGARWNVLEVAPLHYLGEISYATYLGHFLLYLLFKMAFVDDPHAIPPLLIALFLLMVLGLSVALYHLVERPAQRWVNALAPPGRSRAKAAT